MTRKEKYKRFCETVPVRIYCQPWWLDAAAGGSHNWDVALVEEGGVIYAAQPFRKIKMAMFTVVDAPPLTRITGPIIAYPEGQKYASKLSFEKDVMTKLIAQLPAFDYFEQYFDYPVLNYLPYRWAGFKQQTYFSYIIPDLSDPDFVFQQFRSNIKTDIRKAEKIVNVEEGEGIERFYRILDMTFQRQGRKNPVPLDIVRCLDEAGSSRGQRKIFFAVDPQGKIHAAIYIVWDQRSAYYLLSGGDPDLRNSGATSLLLWHAMRFCADKTKQFDFEGSISEPIERFFRAFGAVQTPYHRIHKENAWLLRIRNCLRP